MTTHEVFWQKPGHTNFNMVPRTADLPIPSYQPGIFRSSSDSVVVHSSRPSAGIGSSLKVEQETGSHISQRDDVAIHTREQGTLLIAMRSSTPSKLPTKFIKARHTPSKVRHELQLPSFQALGIANPFPTSIPTPPDEPASLNWTSADMADTQLTPTIITQSGNTLVTPGPSDSIHSTSNDTSTQGAAGSLVSPSIPSAQSHGSGSSASSSATEIPSNMPWLEGAVGAVVPYVASASNTMSVVTVLHQSQPCPLSRDVPGAPSALTGIITALQTRFEQVSANRYIDVTHAVPAKSNFSSLPTSPVATPNRPTIEASMGDYFSVPKTTVYSRATVAASHAESQEVQAKHPGTKSFVPQTVVAPSSIDVSVFQRFIPPPTKKELEDLFKSDRPSALVDRLSELKPDHGKLVFVYPTRDGALTFRGDYLGPVLDPHMRTMVEVLGISRDAAADIAYLAPVYEMHDFHGLRVKVSQLLAGMNRMAGGNLHRFSIVSASQETVYIGREAWAEWFIEQEQPRIREIMNASYGRKPGRPLTGGGGDYTAAGLVREIFDAIKDRAYEPGQAPREGIEVGVFVIKRTQ